MVEAEEGCMRGCAKNKYTDKNETNNILYA